MPEEESVGEDKWGRPALETLHPDKENLVFQQLDIDHYIGLDTATIILLIIVSQISIFRRGVGRNAWRPVRFSSRRPDVWRDRLWTLCLSARARFLALLLRTGAILLQTAALPAI
jgi:hypothetical protein